MILFRQISVICCVVAMLHGYQHQMNNDVLNNCETLDNCKIVDKDCMISCVDEFDEKKSDLPSLGSRQSFHVFEFLPNSSYMDTLDQHCILYEQLKECANNCSADQFVPTDTTLEAMCTNRDIMVSFESCYKRVAEVVYDECDQTCPYNDSKLIDVFELSTNISEILDEQELFCEWNNCTSLCVLSIVQELCNSTDGMKPWYESSVGYMWDVENYATGIIQNLTNIYGYRPDSGIVGVVMVPYYCAKVTAQLISAAKELNYPPPNCIYPTTITYDILYGPKKTAKLNISLIMTNTSSCVRYPFYEIRFEYFVIKTNETHLIETLRKCWNSCHNYPNDSVSHLGTGRFLWILTEDIPLDHNFLFEIRLLPFIGTFPIRNNSGEYGEALAFVIPVIPYKDWKAIMLGFGVAFASIVAIGGIFLWKLKTKRKKRIRGKDLTKISVLGDGKFCQVWKATYQHRLFQFPTKLTAVSLKILKSGATEARQLSFMEEALIQSNIEFKYIVSVIGTCLEKDPKALVLEYCNAESLLSYMQHQKGIGRPLPFSDKIRACRHLSLACRHLENKFYIHRDIKAQNCMVNLIPLGSFHVKLGNFGLAKDVRGRYNNEYHTDEKDFPIVQTAPEGFRGVFSSKSDVWSYGVLVWQIFTDGRTPYGEMDPTRVYDYVWNQDGTPITADLAFTELPQAVCDLLGKCWEKDPKNRPSFSSIVDSIGATGKKVWFTPRFKIESIPVHPNRASMQLQRFHHESFPTSGEIEIGKEKRQQPIPALTSTVKDRYAKNIAATEKAIAEDTTPDSEIPQDNVQLEDPATTLYSALHDPYARNIIRENNSSMEKNGILKPTSSCDDCGAKISRSGDAIPSSSAASAECNRFEDPCSSSTKDPPGSLYLMLHDPYARDIGALSALQQEETDIDNHLTTSVSSDAYARNILE